MRRDAGRRREALARLEEATEALQSSLRDAAIGGVRQSDLARISGWSRETLRKLNRGERPEEAGSRRAVRGTSPDAAEPDTEIALTESDLWAVLLGTLTPAELAARDTVTVTGDIGRLTDLLGHLAAPGPDFAIVTP
ncbi:alkyl sulfatase C-terminal domain-containing protein [Streptomyces nogalater]